MILGKPKKTKKKGIWLLSKKGGYVPSGMGGSCKITKLDPRNLNSITLSLSIAISVLVCSVPTHYV